LRFLYYAIIRLVETATTLLRLCESMVNGCKDALNNLKDKRYLCEGAVYAC
jgi:hypothetical protein